MADDLPIEESDIDFISPEVAKEMRQTVYNATLRVTEHEEVGFIVTGHLESSQSMAKRGFPLNAARPLLLWVLLNFFAAAVS